MQTITVQDKVVGGATEELTLEFLTERVTVREILRSRIYQEVSEHNAKLRARPFNHIHDERERLLNRERTQTKLVDWETQLGKAIEGFNGNRIIILCNDRQMTDLEEEVDLRPDTKLAFLRLVPLVGG